MATKKKNAKKQAARKQTAQKKPTKKQPTKKQTAQKKPAKKTAATSSTAETAAIREALEQLIFEVLPRAERLTVGNANFFLIRKGDNEQSICGTVVRKGVVGLKLPAEATYDDSEKRLVGKGPAALTLWIESRDNVAFARRYVEAALASSTL
jgi:hypothetical protein